jgi:hypothetical protein
VLKLDDGPLGVGPEYSVGLAGVETEIVQAGLELSDIVPTKHRTPQQQQAVTEAVPGFIQCPPSVRSDDPVNADATLRLECLHGLGRGRSELAPRVAVARVAEGVEPVLDVADRLARVT